MFKHLMAPSSSSCMECVSHATAPTTQVTPGERKLETFKQNIRYIAIRYDMICACVCEEAQRKVLKEDA